MVQIVSGDETGLLKVVELRRKQLLSRCGEQSRSRQISHLAWLPQPGDADDIATSSSKCVSLSKAGVVEVWDTTTANRMHKCVNAGANPVLLACRRGGFLTCAQDGVVRLFSQAATDAAVEHAGSRTFSVGPDIYAAALHRDGSLAVGGKEHDVTVWDSEKGVEAWRARNVMPSKLDLRVPVWVRGISFLRDVGSGDPAAVSPNLLAAVSSYKHVRLYDIRAGQRPVQSVEMGEHPFTCIAQSEDGRSLITGDTAGALRRIDVGTLKLTGVFKGPVGCIKSLSVHQGGLPYVAAVGLDRQLRVYNTQSRQLVRQLYMKQRLTSVLFEPAAASKARGAGKATVDDMVPEGPKPGAGRRAQPGPGMVNLLTDSHQEGDEQEEGDGGGVWAELDRRAAQVASAASSSSAKGKGKAPAEASSSGVGNKRSKTAVTDEEMDEGAQAEDSDVDATERWGDGGDNEEDEEDDGADSDDDGEEGDGMSEASLDDDDDDDDDGDSDDDDDFDDDDDEQDEDDDGVAALVDSRKAAKSMLAQTDAIKAAGKAGKGAAGGRGGARGGKAAAAAAGKGKAKGPAAASAAAAGRGGSSRGRGGARTRGGAGGKRKR